MRAWADLAAVMAEDGELEEEEIDALVRLELFAGLVTVPVLSWPSLVKMRISPPAVLLASVSVSELSQGPRTWSQLAVPFGVRGLSSSECWAVTMGEAKEAGLFAGDVPSRIDLRSASVVTLGARLRGFVGVPRVRLEMQK
jgi:hypothetical protein